MTLIEEETKRPEEDDAEEEEIEIEIHNWKDLQ